MNELVIFRLAIAAGIIVAAIAAYRLLDRWMISRASGRAADVLPGMPQKPVLVYFTTPTCAPCKTVQGPAIEQVRGQLGEGFQVIEVDAAARPEVARRWGVLSVPTTFVLDARGRARFVNNGIARADKLLRQIQAV